MRYKKLHAIVARRVKFYKTLQPGTTFGRCDVEKVHAIVARRTFPSQNVQNTPFLDHFWKLRCRKKCTPLWREAHFEVKMLKHQGFGPLFEVAMPKKCTPLWREADFEVKMHKTHHIRTTFGSCDVEKCTPLWRKAHFEVKMLKKTHLRATFGRADVIPRGRCKRLSVLSKVSKT